MKWVELDEWYSWLPTDRPENDAPTHYLDTYALIPDDLADRYRECIDELKALQDEIEPYAGKRA